MNIKHTGIKFLKEYALHLKNLPEADRYTRFGYKVSNYQIDQLILSILYSPNDHHLFTAYADGNIIGFCHLAGGNGTVWELAVSVDAKSQGKGIADKLMSDAIQWAKTHNVHTMFMHCINDNKKIQHLAKKHNLLVVDRSPGEVTAEMLVPAATAADHMSQFVRARLDIVSKIQRLYMKLFTSA